MSKPIKNMIVETYRRTLEGVTDAVLVDLCGVTSNENNALRAGLASKKIRLLVVKNALAKQAFAKTPLEPAEAFLAGPTAVAYGADSAATIAREVLDWGKKVQQFKAKGAVMERQIFQASEVDRLSHFPSRREAQSQVASVILGPAGALLGVVVGAGATVAGLVDALVKKLEQGETAVKVA